MEIKKYSLISFVGSHDPWGKEKAPTGGFPYGPIITTIKIAEEKNLKFNTVYLLATKGLYSNAENTKKETMSLFPHIEVVIFDTELEDPTDHRLIFDSLEKFRKRYQEDLHNPENEIFIAITSGTPAIHACLLMSCASNLIPGKLIHLKEARFTPSQLPEYRIIDLKDPRFPKVSPEFSPTWQMSITDIPSSFESFGIIGKSEKLISECRKAWKLAKSGTLKSILILGETGTGKELVAKLIHRASGRPEAKYQARNINEYSSELLRSELFGHKKGSFTGAFADKKGLLEVLNGGTLFLDEIGDCSLEIQSQLLRVLDYCEFSPVGSNEVLTTDILFIFATNKDPKELIKTGKMRQDFYNRIREGVINLPPLRERREDIPLLVEYFILQHNKKPIPKVPPETMKKLLSHHWPGNIRELKIILQGAIALMSEDGVISPEAIEFDQTSDEELYKFLPTPHPGFKLDEYINKIRDILKDRAIEIANGNLSEAGKLLGITPQAMAQHKAKKNKSK
ncbi:MAG: RNA repair transcriptional activator RtcR family protein [Candidatus Hydrogenedentes bacterium]|nr:RNA repair transcriptional activator RtcR family protein [Candidatus Hydrogenedentota bacterium]